MYYSSESSDSETVQDDKSLDFSYLLLDSEAMSLQLKNSIYEQIRNKAKRERQKYTGLRTNKYKDTEHDMNSLFLQPSRDLEESELFNSDMNTEEIEQASSSQDADDDHMIFDEITQKLYLQHNLLLTLPFELILFTNLKLLDLSSNSLTHINDFLSCLVNLHSLYLKNNGITDDSLPKDLSSLHKLRELNLSGNKLTKIPHQIYELVSLKFLYMGNNDITEILPDIKNLQNLQVLQLGGNQLQQVPAELGQLSHLGVLALCDNRLRRLPRAISQLTRLRSLLLHKNNLCCLPVEIVKLSGLNEISLRDNPLVNKFLTCCAKEIIYTPPSLLELAARTIKLTAVTYSEGDIPAVLHEYLNLGQKCVNPKCKGVYFTSRVEHIKFVDFCGMYRVPLMHYLCSSRCTSTTPTYYESRMDYESDEERAGTLKKVLLG